MRRARPRSQYRSALPCRATVTNARYGVRKFDDASKDFTSAIPAAEIYDDLKVRAALNEIDGRDHTGQHAVGTPALFGMNFQAVNVAKDDVPVE